MSWKNFARPIAALLFDLFLLAAIGSYTLLQVTQPTNLKTTLADVLSSQIDQTYNGAVQACQQNNSSTFTFNITDKTITATCADVNSGKGNFTASLANQVFNAIYYQNYTCDFLQCVQQGQFPQNILVVFSAYGNSFFNEIFLYSVIATVAFAIILLVSYDTMADRLRGFGKILLWEGVPFLVLTFLIGGVLSSFLPQSIASATSGISNQLTSTTQYVFAAMAVAGAILYSTGVFLQRKQKRK